MIDIFAQLFINSIEVVGDITEKIQTFFDNLPNFISLIFTVLQTAVLGFITDSRDKFIDIGGSFASALGFGDISIITNNFMFWILGVFVGFWILKFIITASVELVSKFIDPM